MKYFMTAYYVKTFPFMFQQKKSVLKDTETKAMLEIMGKTRHSEGLKEVEDDEDMSEEMKKKMNTIPKMF